MMVYQSYLFTLTMPAAVLSYINADIGPDINYTWISVRYAVLTLFRRCVSVTNITAAPQLEPCRCRHGKRRWPAS
jgi:hypothetical protein